MNNLNGLSSVTRSGTLTVAGTTTGTATNVTVNSTNATLYNDKTFAKDGFTVTNGNNTYTAIAQDSYNRKDTNSVVFNLPSTVNYIYDLNGNLTSDSTRGFDYDDENELIRVTVTNTWKSEFTYDGRMRRRIRKEFAWQNSAWVVTNEVRYIYDGNLEIQWRDGNNLPTLTLTRGCDLSGSLRGAGGIGGLLARTDAANGQTAYFHADGNGNVSALVNAQQIIVAKYLYDPFGNTLSKAGPLADANTYRFSSKDYHANSGLYYYGYRFYDPNLQCWLNRDPIGEFGGLNLYGYVANNPISFVDPFGEALYPADFIGPLQRGDWRQTVFRGFENPRYQQNDQAIHDWVNDFNANKDAYCGCTARQQGGVPDATFDQVKSWLIQESGGSDARSRAAWNTDPAQVNVPGRDWDRWKEDLGLTKPRRRNEGTLDGNLGAALGWLCRKGFWEAARPVRDYPERFFDGWFDAFRRYNGRTVVRRNGQPYSVNYANQIINRASNPGVHYPIQLP